jgi:hypothetical protein
LDKKALAEIEERLLEANKVIAKLDSSIRATAFDILKPYVLGGKPSAHADSPKEPPEEVPSSDIAHLIDKHGSGKPHENVNLLAAIWFSEYGSHPFSLQYIRDKATSTGVTIPAHPNMTLRQAKSEGKKLYEPMGEKGLYKPTVVGETFFKTTYGLKKGTKVPPDNPK